MLKAGTYLGQYEVLGHLGSGGMGEVYHARDSKLNREVALKVLPEQFVREPERIGRLRREAQVLASLDHPNIARIYAFEESGSARFLVMELVLGETLKERSQKSGVRSQNKTGVAFEEALGITKQIAEGLEHAHEKTVIHRDLKPANVKVTPEGVVKILDFGLAKALAGDAGSGDPSDSPTLSAMTQPGTILGTAAYMSPEQARGKKVDKHTDIWALGCVLYELLTGKHAFDGEDVPEILAAVMKGEPDWTALPATTPPNVRFALRRCLEKDAKRRFHSATDVAIALEEPWSVAAAEALPVAPSSVPRPLWRRATPWTLAVFGTAIVTGLAIWNLRQPLPRPPRPIERLEVTLAAEERFPSLDYPVMAFSPDGSQLAYKTNRGIYVRAMDSFEARLLPGTQDASDLIFSPDGQWLGFFAGALKKVSVSGGAVSTLTNAVGFPRGANWGPNGMIVFAPAITGGLSQISAAGGEPQELTKLKGGEISHRWPQFLPDGKSVLFTVQTGGNPDDYHIAVQRPNAAEHQILIRGGTYARYVPSGHLVYYRAGTIMAVPFDPVRLEVMGTPTPVIEGVMAGGINNTGAAQFSFSILGSLAYVPGTGTGLTELTLVWVDRKGAEQPLPAPPRAYDDPRLSPDGRQIALIEGSTNDVWVYDIPRATLARLTFDGAANVPLWTPDGKRIVFASDKAGAWGLYWKPADGSGAEEHLMISERPLFLASVSPDSRILAFYQGVPNTGNDIWILPLEGDPRQPSPASGAAGAEGRKPKIFLQTPFAEAAPMFAPDGRWIAYISNESGRNEVYVQPFPGPGGKYLISSEGGNQPLWSRNGRELFYRNGDKMMAVDITTELGFRAGTPRMLFERSDVNTGARADYDISPDGQRFLMFKPKQEPQAAAATQIRVVLNWFEELQRRVPVP